MLEIGVKQECPLSLILFDMYIDELEKYLDEINGDSPCLFDMVVIIFLYADDVVLISKLGVGLQEL